MSCGRRDMTHTRAHRLIEFGASAALTCTRVQLGRACVRLVAGALCACLRLPQKRRGAQEAMWAGRARNNHARDYYAHGARQTSAAHQDARSASQVCVCVRLSLPCIRVRVCVCVLGKVWRELNWKCDANFCQRRYALARAACLCTHNGARASARKWRPN